MSDFMVTCHDNRLFITLRIPITMRSSRYKFYLIQKSSVSVLDNPDSLSILDENIFGIAVPVHVPLGHTIFQTQEQAVFRKGILDLTENDMAILPYSYKHCIIAIFRDSIVEVKSSCNFIVARKSPDPLVVHLVRNRVLLNNVDSV